MSSVAHPSADTNHNLSGVRKAAIFLVAVGEEIGRKILQNLSEPDIDISEVAAQHFVIILGPIEIAGICVL